MRRLSLFFIASLCLAAAPAALAQQSENHVEFGAFADYFRLSYTSPSQNYFGLGGRFAFNVQRNVQIEAEMAYDFKRNYTTTYNNGITSTTVTSGLRTLHGYFGPKFQTGAGPFRFFVSAKAGFDNFSASTQNPPTGFSNSVTLNGGTTDFALYPSGGVEAFAGPIGIRAEAGDDVFFQSGAHNNLRVTFGPQFRF
jgi:hypothetical protein